MEMAADEAAIVPRRRAERENLALDMVLGVWMGEDV